MYILLTETHKLRLRYEIETGTKERFSLRKNPETVRKRPRAAARKENHNVRVAAQQHGGWDAAEAEFLEGSWLTLDWEVRTPALN